MLRFFLCFFFVISTFSPVVFAQSDHQNDGQNDGQTANWKYYSNIIIPSYDEDVTVGVSLNDNLTTQLYEGYRDLRIFNQDLEEIPYTLQGQIQNTLANSNNIIELSLNGETKDSSTYQLENLHDDNRKSLVQFPSTAKTVSLTYKMPQSINIDKINSFSYDPFNTWAEVFVEASNDLETWDVVRSRIDIDHAAWRWFGLTSKKAYTYYRITFYNVGNLILNELQLLSDQSTTLAFEAQPQTRLYLVLW